MPASAPFDFAPTVLIVRPSASYRVLVVITAPVLTFASEVEVVPAPRIHPEVALWLSAPSIGLYPVVCFAITVSPLAGVVSRSETWVVVTVVGRRNAIPVVLLTP